VQPFLSVRMVDEGVDAPSSGDAECAICMSNMADSVSLPCSCKVDYCRTCWDKALARSLTSQGQPSCPTCRCPILVDFDADTCLLKFSRADPDSDEHKASCTVDRLAHQAQPAQTRLLKTYGDARPHLKDIAQGEVEVLKTLSIEELKEHIKNLGGDCHGCAEKDDHVQLLKRLGGPEAALWAQLREEEKPKCVCNSHLVRTSIKERHRSYRMLRGSDAESDLARFAMLSMQNALSIICDVCDGEVTVVGGGYCWTCQNGDGTVLHASNYDVCDRCFMKHALNIEEAETHIEEDGTSTDAS